MNKNVASYPYLHPLIAVPPRSWILRGREKSLGDGDDQLALLTLYLLLSSASFAFYAHLESQSLSWWRRPLVAMRVIATSWRKAQELGSAALLLCPYLLVSLCEERPLCWFMPLFFFNFNFKITVIP